MIRAGQVLKVTKHSDGSFAVKLKEIEPPPEKDKVLGIEEWAYDEFKDALLHDKGVEWTEDEGGNVVSVTIIG